MKPPRCLYSLYRLEDLFSETQKTLSQVNVPNCVQTLSRGSAIIRLSVTAGGDAFGAACRTGVQNRKKVRMPDEIRGLARRRPLWIITCYRNNRMDVLTIDPDGDDGGSLPVFSFEEEAQTFLGLSENDQEEGRRWRSRETTAGELVSVLLAPCADVRRVMLDPLPLSLGRLMAPLCSVTRERFLEDLMGSRGEPTGELVPA